LVLGGGGSGGVGTTFSIDFAELFLVRDLLAVRLPFPICSQIFSHPSAFGFSVASIKSCSFGFSCSNPGNIPCVNVFCLSVFVTVEPSSCTKGEGIADLGWVTFSIVSCTIGGDAVCFGTLAQRSPESSKAILGFLDLTSPHVLRVFDVNLRQSFYTARVIDESMQRANFVKLNHEELPVVSRLLGLRVGDELEQCQRLIDRYSLDGLALTRGDQGSALCLLGKLDQQPALGIQAIDTVGAGDAFCAVLIMGILAGEPLSQIHTRASRIAAYVCTQRGAVVPIPPSLLD
jgi:hypothetical protein